MGGYRIELISPLRRTSLTTTLVWLPRRPDSVRLLHSGGSLMSGKIFHQYRPRPPVSLLAAILGVWGRSRRGLGISVCSSSASTSLHVYSIDSRGGASHPGWLLLYNASAHMGDALDLLSSAGWINPTRTKEKNPAALVNLEKISIKGLWHHEVMIVCPHFFCN